MLSRTEIEKFFIKGKIVMRIAEVHNTTAYLWLTYLAHSCLNCGIEYKVYLGSVR